MKRGPLLHYDRLQLDLDALRKLLPVEEDEQWPAWLLRARRADLITLDEMSYIGLGLNHGQLVLHWACLGCAKICNADELHDGFCVDCIDSASRSEDYA